MEQDQNDFIKKMENINRPHVETRHHQQEFRLTLLNTRKSGFVGIILLILPFLFLTGVVFKHYLQMDIGLFTAVYDWIGELDRKYGDASAINWIVRILLLVGPLVAVFINLMAITHIHYEKTKREMVLSFKMNWLNWLIIIICSAVFAIFFLYLIAENI